MNNYEKAHSFLDEFKGSKYLYGPGVISRVREVACQLGERPLLVADHYSSSEIFIDRIKQSLQACELDLVQIIPGARPNAPREDLFRIAKSFLDLQPDVIISFGGGSTIDAVKAAEVLRTLGGEIEEYFGTGLVTEALANSGRNLTPHIAIQTAASSAAHLTKYSNITDVSSGQKKLIVDEAIVPRYPVFDYETTYAAPYALTADGALDGLSHILEVLYGAVGKPHEDRMFEVAEIGIQLILNNLKTALTDPQNRSARGALCLATDLGGYAIMLGGTNGAHLTSFSLVDILSHGRACAIMNPYYTVFFAPAIPGPLQLVGDILKTSGYIPVGASDASRHDLGLAVASGLIAFMQDCGFPVTLGEIPGFSEEHICRALTAAKNPQLKMKLENMPVPLTSEQVDEYMRPILVAAQSGDLRQIQILS